VTKTITIGHVERVTVKGGIKFCIYEGRTPEQRGWSACYETRREWLAGLCEVAIVKGQRVQIDYTEDHGAFTLESATLVERESDRAHLHDVHRTVACWCGAAVGEPHKIEREAV
jgi:hypothetical protein